MEQISSNCKYSILLDVSRCCNKWLFECSVYGICDTTVYTYYTHSLGGVKWSLTFCLSVQMNCVTRYVRWAASTSTLPASEIKSVSFYLLRLSLFALEDVHYIQDSLINNNSSVTAARGTTCMYIVLFFNLKYFAFINKNRGEIYFRRLKSLFIP